MIFQIPLCPSISGTWNLELEMRNLKDLSLKSRKHKGVEPNEPVQLELGI